MMMRKKTRKSSGGKPSTLRKKFRENLSTILITVGIIIIVFPFVTEAYGYFKSVQLMQAWDEQADNQRIKADTIRVNQSRLISSGQLPEENAIFSAAKIKKKSSKGQKAEPRKPFPKTKIRIPKIKVDQVILEGTSPGILQLGPGHYAGMANPGEKDNCGIAGHRVTYTHPFNRLDELAKGDLIVLETVDYIYEYEVESMEVTDPKDVSNLQPSSDPRITLTTCNPKYSAKTRLNVMGVLINSKPRRPNIIRVVKQILEEDKKPRKVINKKQRTHAELLRDYAKEKKAVENNPVDAYVYADFSKTCFELNKYAESLEALKRAELIAPDSVDIQKLRAEFEARKKHLEDTVATSERSLAGGMASTDPEPFFELGRMYLATKEYDAAIKAYKRVVQMFPYMSDVHIYEAQAHEVAGDYEMAISAYNEALKYDPTRPEAVQGVQRIQNSKPEPETEATTTLHYTVRPQ